MRLLPLILLTAAIASAAVDSIQLKERTPLAEGKSFGAAGPYERVAATVQFRVDPKLAQNQHIVDLGLAPKDRDGFVRFSADLLVLKPRDPAKSNGTAIIDVVNRGRIVSLPSFNRAPGILDPKSEADLGDGLLMQLGYTVVAIGWQWDTPKVAGRIGLQAPKLDGSITGLARAEFVPDKSVGGFPLGDRDHTPYPVADEKDPANRLFVSDAPDQNRREIPAGKWRFVNKTSVEIDGGCEAGKIYEVVYRATGAVPTGLGFAAVRDIASFMKFGGATTLLDDQQRVIKRTVGFGTSQTGRFLRHFVYQGFNEDEKSRMALDGVWAHVAGAGRGGFNHRFAQPSRDGQPVLHYAWPVDMFPFLDEVSRDPLTGKEDGLLPRGASAKFNPKTFYSNNSYEYWGRAASLIHSSPDGAKDVAPDKNTRIYFFTGGSHGPGSLPLKRTNTQNVENPLDFRWGMRGLLVAFHEWLKDGTEPPPSLYPTRARGELATANELKYPTGVHPPKWPRVPELLDFGPEFVAKGIVNIEPPKKAGSYRIHVPKVDADGIEKGGVRMPEIDVPLGTHAGWNLRGPALGSSDRMIAFTGSFFSFSPADVKKRYPSKQTYLDKIRRAANGLAAKRYALNVDVEKMTLRAGELWDAVHSGQPLAGVR